MSKGVLGEVWNFYPIDTRNYGKGGLLSKGNFGMKLIYVLFAVFVRITGEQDGPKENKCVRKNRYVMQ